MAGVTQPKDQSHFILPDLGEGVHEAEIVRWRVTPGETVKVTLSPEFVFCLPPESA